MRTDNCLRRSSSSVFTFPSLSLILAWKNEAAVAAAIHPQLIPIPHPSLQLALACPRTGWMPVRWSPHRRLRRTWARWRATWPNGWCESPATHRTAPVKIKILVVVQIQQAMNRTWHLTLAFVVEYEYETLTYRFNCLYKIHKNST